MDRSLIGNVGNVIMALIAFIMILYLAYFATKKLGKRMSVRGVGGRSIKIIDSVSIGQKNALLIVETAGKTLLIGVAENGISLITELDGDKINRDEEKKGGGMEFSAALRKAVEQRFGKKLPFGKEKKDDDVKGQR